MSAGARSKGATRSSPAPAAASAPRSRAALARAGARVTLAGRRAAPLAAVAADVA